MKLHNTWVLVWGTVLVFSCNTIERENIRDVRKKVNAFEQKQEFAQPKLATIMWEVGMRQTYLQKAINSQQAKQVKYQTQKIQELLVQANKLYPTYPTLQQPMGYYFSNGLDSAYEAIKNEVDFANWPAIKKSVVRANIVCSNCHADAGLAFINAPIAKP
jgi:hypothetical protein